MRLMLLLQLFFWLPAITQAETWSDLGEPITLTNEQVSSAFIQGACQHLKSAERAKGDIWYVKVDANEPAKIMASDLNDAVFLNVCSSVWKGAGAPLDSFTYIGPVKAENVSSTDDMVSKYGKLFADAVVRAYVDILKNTDCGAGSGSNNNEYLVTEACGTSLDNLDQVVAALTPDCDRHNFSAEACQLIKDAKKQSESLRRERDVLIGLNVKDPSTVNDADHLEAIVMNDVWVRLGTDAVPIILKSKDGCTFSGQVTAKALGSSTVKLSEKVCEANGYPISKKVDITKTVPSKTTTDNQTGELINTIKSGTTIKLK